MKRLSFILAAALLVLGLAQCKKEKTQAQGSGETIVQQVTVGASCNGSNSKVNGQTTGNALKLTWDEGDKMIVDRMDVLSPPNFLTLSEGAGTASGTFSGTIVGVSGSTKLAFVHGGSGARYGLQQGVLTIFAEQFLNQNGKLEKTEDSKASDKNSILDRLCLFADNIDFIASSAAEYNLDLEVPYAILKLDLSAFGTTEGTKVSISAGGSEVASVTGVTNATDNPYYVAMRAAESREYTFSGNGKTAKVTWELEKNIYYTKSDGNGGSTGDAIVVAPEAPKFSVSATKKVVFAPGNLYWNGSAFKFEAHQWDYANTWSTSHVSHFFWSNTTDWQTSGKEPYAASYSYSTRTTSDVFFTNTSGTEGSFTVDGVAGWRTLSRAEWGYLLNSRTPQTTSANFKTLTISGTKATVSGLVLLPDGSTTSLSSINETNDLATYNVVFLPAAGYRDGTSLNLVGSYGYYWSSTPYEDYEDFAFDMYFYSGYVNTDNDYRYYGHAVRLVRSGS